MRRAASRRRDRVAPAPDAHERASLLVQATDDAHWDWDLDTGELWRGPGATAVLGLPGEPDGELVTTIASWTATIHEDDRDRVLAGLGAALEAGDRWRDEYRCRRSDGDVVWVLDQGLAVRDGRGRPVRMVGAMRDVTDLHRLEEQHRRAQRLSTLGAMVGGVVHDLNNALAPVVLATDLLRRSGRTDAEQGWLDTIDDGARQAGDLLEQLLGFVRGADGTRERVDIGELVEEVARLLHGTLPPSVEVRLEVAAETPDVLGDPTQLQQVLVNLCLNARDAMPAGGVLTVAADAVPGPPDPATGRQEPLVRLAVRDTGTGIASEHLGRLFEPFFTTKADDGGTGLGLPTSRAIVERHGGRLEVHSVPGLGSGFEMLLPAARSSTSPPIVEADPPDRRGTALVVDDDPVLLDLTRRVVERAGFESVLAGGGRAALGLYPLHRHHLSVVVTDLSMPEGDGATLVRYVRALDPHIAVIVTTGDPHGLDLGPGVVVLPKPYAPAELIDLVQEMACVRPV